MKQFVPGPLLVLAVALPAQDQRSNERIAKATVIEERVLRWGEGGMPQCPDGAMPIGLSFSGDGQWLAVQVPQQLHCIALSSGHVTSLDCRGSLSGELSGARILARDQWGEWAVALPGGACERLTERVPPRQVAGKIRFSPVDFDSWLVDPSGARAIGRMTARLRDLGKQEEKQLLGADGAALIGPRRIVVWVAWDGAGGGFALAFDDDGRGAFVLFDGGGREVRRFDSRVPALCEFGATGEWLYWIDGSLCRGSMRSGEVVRSDGPEQFRFWPIDPVLGIGVDGIDFCLWSLADVKVVKRVPIGAPLPVRESPIGPAPAPLKGPARPLLDKGVICGGTVTASRHRDRIALASQQGVHVFRVQN